MTTRLSLFCMLLLTTVLVGQSSHDQKAIMQNNFEEYFIQTVDLDNALTQFRNVHQFQEFEMENTQGGTWTFDLFPSNIISEDFVFTKMENGKKTQEKNTNVFPYKGFIKGDPYSRVSLTVADGFLQGTVLEDGVEYTFQNLDRFVKTADKNQILVYENSKSIDTEERTCQLVEKEKIDEIFEEAHKSNAACKGLQLAMADDFLMYQKYGTGVLAHNIAIMNDSQTNYDNEFNDEIEFTLEQIFVAVTAADDPWTNSTDLETLLGDFTSWSTSGGFNVTFDLATLWTDRDFDGSAVGGAWLNGVCLGNRQNAIQDYSANANNMRVVLSHEMGHNFNATHDAGGSGFIMAPAVNNTNTWSPASLMDINNKIASVSCLTGCQGFFSAPTAEFSHDLVSDCSPVTVNFFDESNGDIVSWIWLFPGGSPSYSTDPNPSVFYASDGVYDVTLAVATDGGADEVTSFGEIVLTSMLIADFDYSISESTVILTNNSVPQTANFLWDFGDGNTSTAINPQHTYADDGFYQITLTILSACGDVSFDEFIEISTPPTADFFTNSTFDCQPFTVEFLNNSSSNSMNYFWEFEGGTPETSTDLDPIVVYNEPGVFDVSLTVSNNNGSDQFEIFDYITVDPLPVADFTASTDMFTATFVNLSTDSNSQLWDFGDGNSATTTDPTHIYAANGSYDVILTVTNSCGMDEYTQTVVINNGPASVINYDTNNGCVDLTVNFDGSASSSATSYEWSFEGGDPVSSNDISPTIVYEDSGVFDVSLIVSDGTTSDTLEMSNLIMVNDVPEGLANISSDTMTLFGTVMPDNTFNTTYSWQLGDGNTFAGDTVLHTYATEGIYEVVLTSENECGITTDTNYLNLYTIPNAAFSSTDTEGCAPLEISFTDNSTNLITEWAWSFPGGTPSSSTVANPTVTYPTEGSYDVVLVAINPAGSDTLTEQTFVIVDDVPNAAFLAVNNTTTVTFTNQSTNATSYMWDFGDGNNSTDINPVHVYAQEGTYTVVLTATNDCGTVTQMQEVEVNQFPTAGFLINAEDDCIPFDVQFTDASSANVTSWQWSFEGGTPTSSMDPSPVVSYNNVGSFDVQLIVSSAAGSDTLTMPDVIVADDLPIALYTFAALTEFEYAFNNESTNAINYEWDFGDGFSSIEENPTHTYQEDGVYAVTLRAGNECGTAMFTEEITILPSTTLEIENITAINILPNPNGGQFKLFLDVKNQEDMRLQIINTLGQLVYSNNLSVHGGENIIQVEADDLSNGSYFLSLETRGKRVVKKFLVYK